LAIIYFGQCFENNRSGAKITATCSHGIGCAALFLTKNGRGYILGDFFKNSSCHPDHDPTLTNIQY
jgi:hypothetical protein